MTAPTPEQVKEAVELYEEERAATAEFLRETADMLRRIERENPLHDPSRFTILNEAKCLEIFASQLEKPIAAAAQAKGET